MITPRRSAERGRLDHGWLDARHTFSFGRYHDPRHMGFGILRVLNEDVIAPGAGFGEHPHEDMEIVTYVISGRLAHKDSTGATATLGAGSVQAMSAGRGIRHSEFNASKTDPVHLLQVWLMPRSRGLPPRHEDRHFADSHRRDRLAPIATPDGADGSLRIEARARVFASLVSAGRELARDLPPRASAWVQVVRGDVGVNGVALTAGDGAAIEGEPGITIRASTDAELVYFEFDG